MKIFLKITCSFAMIAVLSGCQVLWLQAFPNDDIVYEAGDYDHAQLGFVNADGSNPVLLNIGDYIFSPAWSVDGKRIYGLARDDMAYFVGAPAFWQLGGKYQECNQWFNFDQINEVALADGSKAVLIKDVRTILLADLDTCKTIDTLVDVSNHGELELLGASYSPDGKSLLYGLQTGELGFHVYHIMKMDVETRQTIEVGAGLSPSWSPDGKQIACLKTDGIYVMNADGSQSRQVLKHIFFDPTEPTDIIDAPLPRWSPDGKWLVYHRCNKAECGLFDNTIFKLELSTGLETELAPAGLFPDWKK